MITFFILIFQSQRQRKIFSKIEDEACSYFVDVLDRFLPGCCSFGRYTRSKTAPGKLGKEDQSRINEKCKGEIKFF